MKNKAPIANGQDRQIIFSLIHETEDDDFLSSKETTKTTGFAWEDGE